MWEVRGQVAGRPGWTWSPQSEWHALELRPREPAQPEPPGFFFPQQFVRADVPILRPRDLCCRHPFNKSQWITHPQTDPKAILGLPWHLSRCYIFCLKVSYSRVSYSTHQPHSSVLLSAPLFLEPQHQAWNYICSWDSSNTEWHTSFLDTWLKQPWHMS